MLNIVKNYVQLLKNLNVDYVELIVTKNEEGFYILNLSYMNDSFEGLIVVLKDKEAFNIVDTMEMLVNELENTFDELDIKQLFLGR